MKCVRTLEDRFFSGLKVVLALKHTDRYLVGESEGIFRLFVE